MDEVHNTREPVLVTKRGKPIAKLVPVNGKKKGNFLGRLEGKVRIVGDIESPVVPLEAWDALR